MFDIDAALSLGLPQRNGIECRTYQLIPRVEHTEVAQVTIEQQARGEHIEIEGGDKQRRGSPRAGRTESIAVRAALRGLAPSTINSYIRRATVISVSL